MCNYNEKNLSLDGDTFAILKEQFDRILNRTVGNMEMKGADDAVITLKLSVSLEKSSVTVGDDIKEVTKPTFKHDISSVMQVKDKISGQTSDDYALVWDENENKYVLRKIENGQMTFDDFADDKVVYDVDYAEVPALGEGSGMALEAAESDETDDGTATTPEAEDDTPDAVSEFDNASAAEEGDEETPYGWLKQFAGTKMHVTEAMGNYTVRTEDNKVVLSSATDPNNVFFCDKSRLEQYIDCELDCQLTKDGDGNTFVQIWCPDREEEVFCLYPGSYNAEPSDEEKAEMLDEAADAVDALDGEDNYQYEQPEE